MNRPSAKLQIKRARRLTDDWCTIYTVNMNLDYRVRQIYILRSAGAVFCAPLCNDQQNFRLLNKNSTNISNFKSVWKLICLSIRISQCRIQVPVVLFVLARGLKCLSTYLCIFSLMPVLQIRDVYPGSEFFPSRIQGQQDSRIPDPHTQYTRKYFNPKNCFQALGSMIWFVHPISGS